MFKVVVSDLDGTLLNKQHQISPRTRDTLHRLVEQGVKFVVATGRHHVDAAASAMRWGWTSTLLLPMAPWSMTNRIS